MDEWWGHRSSFCRRTHLPLHMRRLSTFLPSVGLFSCTSSVFPPFISPPLFFFFPFLNSLHNCQHRRRSTAARILWSLCHDVCMCVGVYVSMIKNEKPWSDWLETWRSSSARHCVEVCWLWIQRSTDVGASLRILGIVAEPTIQGHYNYSRLLHRVMSPRTTLPFESAWICISIVHFPLTVLICRSLQCFDTAGWAAVRASGLCKTECWYSGDGDPTGALHVFQYVSPPLPSPRAPSTSRMLWRSSLHGLYWNTGRQIMMMIIIIIIRVYR